MKQWSKFKARTLFRIGEELYNWILSLQLLESQLGYRTQDNHLLLLYLLQKYHQVLSMQECYWRQKSGIQWLKEGDSNTKFFYRSTVLCNRCNRIFALQSKLRDWQYEEAKIQAILLRHFQTKCNIVNPVDDLWLSQIANTLSLAQQHQLISLIMPHEIVVALRSMNPNKSPCPDSFPTSFF